MTTIYNGWTAYHTAYPEILGTGSNPNEALTSLKSQLSNIHVLWILNETFFINRRRVVIDD